MDERELFQIQLKPDTQRPSFYVLSDLHGLPDSPHIRVSLRQSAWRPPTDVFETEDAYVIRVEIAGMEDADFSIILDGRYLSIRGTRSDIPERRAYHQMEIRYGEFGSDVELPGPVSVKDIEAAYSNGFLQIRLQKTRPVKINVEE